MPPRVPRPQPPTLQQQVVNLHRLHPGLHGRVEGRRLIAEGWLRGNELTERYRVRIEYEPGLYPRARVLEPALMRRHPNQPVAHTNGDNEPCLFTVAKQDWRSGMFIGQTLVPWLMEWLIHYEIWRATGDWKGGGSLPEGYAGLAEAEPEVGE